MRYIFLMFLFCSFSYAHKINLFISNENNNLEIYSYFANGNPCKGCKLTIKNDKDIILQDILNSEGKYNYKATFPSLEVTIDAGEGHIAKERIVLSDVKNEDLKEHIKNEEEKKGINIVIGLLLIFLIFFLLKRFKK